MVGSVCMSVVVTVVFCLLTVVFLKFFAQFSKKETFPELHVALRRAVEGDWLRLTSCIKPLIHAAAADNGLLPSLVTC